MLQEAGRGGRAEHARAWACRGGSIWLYPSVLHALCSERDHSEPAAAARLLLLLQAFRQNAWQQVKEPKGDLRAMAKLYEGL